MARDRHYQMKNRSIFPLGNQMKLNSIFIANNAEIAKPIIDVMPKQARDEEIYEDHAYGDRFVCSNQDNRLLITPLFLDPLFFWHTNNILSFKNVLNLSPKNVDISICEAILKDNQLLRKIIDLIENNPNLIINSYASTFEFGELIAYLQKKGLNFQTPEMPSPDKLWTGSYFGSKSGFRQAVAQLPKNFPKMPEGYICHDQEAIIGWADYFLSQGRGCVLKADRGLAGMGIKIITPEEIQGKNLGEFFENIFTNNQYWNQGTTVVEEYIETDKSVCGGDLNIELKIANNRVIPLYTCGMRITAEGYFRGINFGKDTVPERWQKALIDAGETWGHHLKNYGYQGYFEIDCVLSRSGRLYPLESNVRRTGGTHAYELALRLLGKNFAQKYYIISLVQTEAPRFAGKDYLSLKQVLSGLYFPIQGKKEGLIISIFNYLTKGKLGYIIIGPNRQRVSQIEETFFSRLV